MEYLMSLLFYVSISGFCLNYEYYLKSLLMVEFIVVSVMMVMLWSIFGFSHYFIYVLILSVCEGVVGLLLMVMICRVWGVDMYYLMDYDV